MANVFGLEQTEASSEPGLDEAILEALQKLKITSADPNAMSILRLAAQLEAEGDRLRISTPRLFYAAVMTGLLALAGSGTVIVSLSADLLSQHFAARPGSFAESVARAINNDPSLAKDLYDTFKPLIPLKPINVESMLPLQVEFSPNTARILEDAAVERMLSGDAILRSIFSHDQGSIYRRVPIKRIAEATEKLRPVTFAIGPLTLQNEVDAALAAAISFPILDQLRIRLYQAAKIRTLGKAITISDIVESFARAKENFSDNRRSADPSTLLFDTVSALDNVPGTPLPR